MGRKNLFPYRDINGIVLSFNTFVRNPTAFLFRIIPATANEPLDTIDCVFGIGYALAFCQLTHEANIAFAKTNNTWRSPCPFCVGNDKGITALKDRNTAIGSAKIDANYFAHGSRPKDDKDFFNTTEDFVWGQELQQFMSIGPIAKIGFNP